MTKEATIRRDTPQPVGRPTLVVGSAERAVDELRTAAATQISALLKAETDRGQVATRAILASLKDALAGLERSYDETIATRRQAEQGDVASVVEKLAAAATTASEASAERARAEVRAELEKAQATLDSVRIELERTRTNLEAALAAVEQERSTRVQAETSLKEAERARIELASVHDAELQRLRAELDACRAEIARAQQQIDAEKAERARLVSAIQRVVEPGAIAGATATATPPGAPAPPATTPVPKSTPPPERMAKPEPEPELVTYVQHLFNTLESMYAADVSARRSPDELVTRLTQNLRSARNVFRNHVGTTDSGALALFDDQLAQLLANEDKPFARHLGIAAYECAKGEQP